MKVYSPTEEHGATVFTRPGYVPPHHYSDGRGVEDRLLEIVSEARDRSTGSPELKAAITDWPTNYHLNSERTNLLRPFASWFKGASVLEVGCGCGALTRFLGETGADVTAVEPSAARARIAALRCAGLDNVRVYVDDLAAFEPGRRFAFIMAVGVLEYSPLYGNGGRDAVANALRRLLTSLDPEGVLLIAIENQLGLRYFNGFPEEHVHVPYYGIHDMYSETDPVTLGRRHWLELLTTAGFRNTAFYYPFPDYKFPRVLLTPQVLTRHDLDLAHMIGGAGAERLRPQPNPPFSEAAAWKPLVRNGLVPDLANSFLITASNASAPPRLESLAYFYSDGRAPEFAAETVIKDRAGTMVAVKRKLYPALPSDKGGYTHVTGEGPVTAGEVYETSLDSILLRPGWSGADVAAWALPWYHFLQSACIAPGLLPPPFVDCVPANLVRETDSALQPFDLEYEGTEPIRVDFVLFRGLWASLHARAVGCAVPSVDTSSCIAEEVSRIVRLLIPFTPEQLNEVIRLEATFQAAVTGARVQDTERRLRQAQFSYTRHTPSGTGTKPATVQVFWREREGVYEELNSATTSIATLQGRIESRLEIPPGFRIDAVRLDVCDRPAVLADLQITILDAADETVVTVPNDCAGLPVNDLLVIPLPFSETSNVAVALSNDPHIQCPIHPQHCERLAGGGSVTISFECVDSPVVSARLTDLLRALAADATAAKTALEEATSRTAVLDVALAAANARLDLTTAQLRDLWSEVAECRFQLAERDTQLQQARARLQDANFQLKAVTSRLHDVLNSYTWRLSMATVGRLVRLIRRR